MSIPEDFRVILRSELERRLARNARYSLRAYARDLDLAPALLSDILNAKRGLSRESALGVAKRIGLSNDETELFCDLVESKHARSASVRKQATQRLTVREKRGGSLRFTSIQQDHFQYIADWHHFAILELMAVPGWKNDPHWIAKRLQISVLQVKSALERMISIGLVRKEGDAYFQVCGTFETPDGVPNSALRSHHDQFIQKALNSLHNDPIEERDFRGLTIRCRKEDVPMVRTRIRDFLQKLDADLSANNESTEVYQFLSQFFSLTRPASAPGEHL